MVEWRDCGKLLYYSDWEKFFKYMPIESLIKKNQEEYYKAIYNCNNAGNSNEFIEFMLKMIGEAISEAITTQRNYTRNYTRKNN